MKQNIFSKQKDANAGFTLVELALTVAILGVVTAMAISMYQRANQQRAVQLTYDRMDQIVQAMSVYVETAGRIPCPADPANLNPVTYGWERGVTAANLQVQAGKFPVGSCNPSTREGIVPFMTLGLPEQFARDGWGRYFTYSVSPVFSRANDQASTLADSGIVHGRCRHSGWVYRFDNFNRNAVKARFCCTDIHPTNVIYNWTTDLVIQDGAGNTLSPQRSTTEAFPIYDQITTSTTATHGATGDIYPVIDTSPIAAPAFALVSHGPNGEGAYFVNGTNGRDVPASPLERENANGDALFFDRPVSMGGGASYFDDIVRWMTQDGIIAAHGALSCQYP